MMPALEIRARHPLGVFRGHHGGGGSVSGFPDTARLHAALIHAAGTGSTAVIDGRHLRPSERAIRALEWLESHPPSELSLPQTRILSTGCVVYREEGVFEGGATNPRPRKVAKSQSDGVALPASTGWGWRWEDAPEDVIDTIGRLCEDVSCLGETDSPAVLELAPTDATHTIAPEVGELASGDFMRVATPLAGRFDELESAHRASQTPARPTTVDRHTWSQTPGSHRPPRDKVRPVAYAPVAPSRDARDLPWTHAVVLPVHGKVTIPDTDRVLWATALHAAIASRLGDDAPPLVTGTYPKGAARPANRVAVHLMDLHDAEGDEMRTCFVVMIPAGSSHDDIAWLAYALHRIDQVYVGRRRSGSVQQMELGRPSTVQELETFWPAPAAGKRRLWRPHPAFVPEVRRQPGDWTLSDAAMLSIAFVVRDQIGSASGRDRYRQLVDRVRDRGVSVSQARRIADSRVERYAHRMPKGVPAVPMVADVDMADLVPSRALFAIGQSRHLGGGLMWPVDVALNSEVGCG